MKLPSALLGLLGLAGSVCADPTWPSQIDELEEIMFQLTSFRARRFAGPVSPCSSEASGPGRVNAAEWLRTAFHDMATANTFFGNGGLDASLQYELRNTENLGPGLNTTLIFMSPFFSRRSSLSDLIALGVYTSVRSCGGPAVPFRAGRRDATIAGPPGVPQAQNTAFTFQQQFDRMGFTPAEMIQVTACGHTLGGVHSAQFPDIAPPASTVNTNGQLGLDTTVANFDNRVVTEYLSGNTTNPLVVGPSVRVNRHADFKVYNSDRNVTMQALADPEVFRDVCRTVLQKMIDVVPRGVTLTDSIVPYAVKPVNLQLTLTSGGSTLQFTGFIRVRTTVRPEDDISTVVINYKARDGSTNCGSSSCTIRTTVQGVSQGFDDTFAFFPITANIPASTGISSFTVTVNHVDGTSETFDNNGNEYPMDDAILIQYPQSCLRGTTGALTVVAAVRNDRVSQGARAFVSFKVPQTTSSVPGLRNATVVMERGSCVGRYTFFSANYTIEGGLAYESNLDVINGDRSDSFKSVNNIGGTCRAFANPAACQSGASSSSSSVSTRVTSTSSSASTSVGPTATSVSSFATSIVSSGTTSLSSSGSTTLPSSASSASSTSSTPSSSSPPSTSSVSSTSSTFSTSSASSTSAPASVSSTTSTPATSLMSSSSLPAVTPSHVPTIGGYNLVSCWSEGDGVRALSGRSFAADDMTLQRCMEYCSEFIYWGTEYSTECYCGNYLASSSDEAPLEQCNMVCGGDDGQFCGAGHRLELYSTTSAPPFTLTSITPEPTAVHVEEVGKYDLVGCWTEAQDTRALGGRRTTSAEMTNELCAEFCDDYKYFGTEYSSECYCGNFVASGSSSAPLDECSMRCSGRRSEYCGAGHRLNLYMNPEAETQVPEQPAAAGEFVWLSCQTDQVSNRTLNGATLSSDDMTNEVCAEFCQEFEYFGTEYGRECFCGGSLPARSAEAPDTECSMLCGGSGMEFCGGPDRLSTYVKQEEVQG